MPVQEAEPIGLTREYVRTYIAAQRGRRQANRVLHGHPGPKFLRPLEESAESILEKRLANSRGSVSLYCGMPFCLPTSPGHCGFCLFPTEYFTGPKQTEEYLAYFHRETRLLKPFYGDDKITSVYFGGGTPNLYKPHQYKQLMQYLDGLYGGLSRDIEVTLEGIPQLFNEDKIRAMAEAGINRVSMGAQQISDRLIRHSGRKQTQQQVLDAIALFRKYGLANSVDLIYGWPEQTAEDMLSDLKILVDAGVSHLTHYELNIAGRSAFARPAMRPLLPTIDDNRRMYHLSCEYLRSEGFEQVTVYDWRRIPRDQETRRQSTYQYEQDLHRFDVTDGEDDTTTRQMCGIGYAALSFHCHGMAGEAETWGLMNSPKTPDYRGYLDEGKLPVQYGFKYAPEDVRLAWLFQTMQTMHIDGARYQELFGHDIHDSLGHFIDELSEEGWVEEQNGAVKFVADGQYHIPMLQALIAGPRVDELTTKRPSRLIDIPVVESAAPTRSSADTASEEAA